jgi:hypothetical protein
MPGLKWGNLMNTRTSNVAGAKDGTTMMVLFLIFLLIGCSSFVRATSGSSVNLAVTDLGNGSYAISGNGIPGQIYNIQFVDSIDSTNWQTLDQVQADTNGAFVFIDDESGSPQGFYRTAAAATIGSMPAGFFCPTNILGMAYYWNFNDLPANVATTSWTDRLQNVVLKNYSPGPYNPTNTALGLMLPNNGSGNDILSNATIAIGSNFTLWMVIRERLNLQYSTVPQYACLFGSLGGPHGLMLNNGVIGCDWGNGSGTIGGAMMSNWPIDLVYSQGNVYTNGVALSGNLPQPANNFKFQCIGDTGPGTGAQFTGYIQYIGIWTNTLFSATDVSNLDDWVNTNGVTNITGGNLTGWWKLNDGSGTSVSDSSGYGYTGTVMNGTSPASSATWLTSAPTGGGLQFDGASTAVTFGSIGVDNQNCWSNVTWVFWVNTSIPNSDESLQEIPIALADVTGSGYYEWLEAPYMRWAVVQDSTNWVEADHQNVSNDGRWHQEVVTIGSSPQSLTIYQDGELNFGPNQLTGTAGYIGPSGVHLSFGTSYSKATNNPYTPYFNGSLADVRFYTNTVFTWQQVADIFRWRGQQ